MQDIMIEDTKPEEIDVSKFRGGGRWIESLWGPRASVGHKVASGFTEEHRGETKTIHAIKIKFSRDPATNEHVCDLHALALHHAREYQNERLIPQTREALQQKAQELLKQIWEYILQMPEWKSGQIVERVPYEEKLEKMREEQMSQIPTEDIIDYMRKQGFDFQLPPEYASERLPQRETPASPDPRTTPMGGQHSFQIEEQHSSMEGVGNKMAQERQQSPHSGIENLF